jgi:hypothetical protein
MPAYPELVVVPPHEGHEGPAVARLDPDSNSISGTSSKDRGLAPFAWLPSVGSVFGGFVTFDENRERCVPATAHAFLKRFGAPTLLAKPPTMV